MKKLLTTILVAGSCLLGGVAAQAEKSGGTLSFLVQPEPPTLASYVSTSGPIGLVMPKVYEGLFDYCLLYTSPSPRDYAASRMPSSA